MKRLSLLSLLVPLAVQAAPFDPTPAPRAGTPANAVFNNIQAQTVVPGTDFATVIAALNNVQAMQGGGSFAKALGELAPNLFSAFEKSTQQTRSLILNILDQRCGEICCKRLPNMEGCHPFSAWVEPMILAYDQHDEGTSGPGFHTLGGGFVAGIDWRKPKYVRLGVAGGYEATHLVWKDSLGSSHDHSGFAGFYGTVLSNKFFAKGDVLVGWDNFDVHRRINFLGFHRHADHDMHGWDLTARVVTGYDFHFINYEEYLRPFFQFDYFQLRQNSYHETGASSIDLRGHRKTSYWSRVEGGMQFSKTYPYEKGCFTPSVGLSYVGYFPLHRKHYIARFDGAATPYEVYGFQRISSRASPFAMLCWQGKVFGASLRYRAEVNNRVDTQEGSIRLECRF